MNFNTQSANSTVTVTNTGNAVLTINAISFSGTYSADFTKAGSCQPSATVQPNATCDVVFSIKPTGANKGPQTADLNITSDGGNKTIAVTYNSIALPVIGVSPASFALGKMAFGAQSGNNTLTVTNTGDAPLTISTISINGTYAPDFIRTGTCQPLSVLPVAATCDVIFAVKPVGADLGPQTADFVIASDGGNKTVTVAYEPVTSPAIQIADAPGSFLSLTALSFGSGSFDTPIPNSPTANLAAKTIYVKNIGTDPMTVNNIYLTGTGEFTFTHNCNAPVLGGTNCQIVVTPFPGSIGSKAGLLFIDTNAFNASPTGPGVRTVTLSATITGTPPVNVVSPIATLTKETSDATGTFTLNGAINFGNNAVGLVSGRRFIRLTNSGASAVQLFAVRATGPQSSWLILGGVPTANTLPSTGAVCGASLAAGANCLVGVDFKPLAVGSAAADIEFWTNISTFVVKVTVSGSGQ
ncbi:MAG: choice-of-anchor D domain-containing protein [Burkholderiales bacterium]